MKPLALVALLVLLSPGILSADPLDVVALPIVVHTSESDSRYVSEGLADLREVVGKINDGQGSIGRLVNDDKIVRDLEIFTQRLASEDSTVGRLFASDDLYVKIAQIAEDVAAVTAKAIINY